MRDARAGEKAGWTLGWLGAFLWVGILAVVLFFMGQSAAAVTGMALFASSLVCIQRFSPWRRPDTPYWKLMAPLYLLVVLSAAWVWFAFGASSAGGFGWWSPLWMLPMLTPLGILGRRTWNTLPDGGAQERSVNE